MSLRMKIEKQKALEEMRKLMAERKNKDKKPTKINNPLAKYNSAGQLTCILCSSIVRSETVWQIHINSKQHRENVEQAKKLKELTKNFTERKIKKRPNTTSGDAPQEKKLKGILKNSQSASDLQITTPRTKDSPVVFSHNEEIKRTVLTNPSVEKEDIIKQTEISPLIKEKEEDVKVNSVNDPPIPEGFFDDPVLDAKVRNIEYKDPVEEEWEKFQKEIKEETSTSAEIIAGEQEEATAERQIHEIDEQIRNWSRVYDLEVKKEETKKKMHDTETMSEQEDNDSDNDMDIDEFFDWRAKKSYS